MTVTWREQIVSYCVLIVARMFADDPQLVQDLRSLSNKITTTLPSPDQAEVARPVAARAGEFQITPTPT